MSELMSAIKEDLTSRRMLPLLVISLGLLAGAVAYAALGGNTSRSVASTPPPASVPAVPGPSVSNAPANPHAAVAETTSGSSYQHHGHVRNPFKPLAGNEPESSGASSGSGTGAAPGGESSGSGSEGSGSGESGSSGSGASGGSEAPQQSEAQPQTLYEVSAKLTQLSSAGKPEGKPLLLEDMKQLRPLPSKKQALFAYAGVASGGNGALLLLLSPAIVHGHAHCLPGPTNCEAIYMKPQQSEQLQYLEESGVVVSYELTLTKFEGVESPAAKVKTIAARLVEEEGELAGTLGVALPGKVHYSEESGLLLGVQDAIRSRSKSSSSKPESSHSKRE